MKTAKMITILITALVSYFILGCTGTTENTPSAYFMVDQNNHRVLMYDTLPTKNTDLPTLVLGQPNFTSNTANNGGVSASALNGPTSAFFDGSHLLISDTNSNRVLIWNGLPTSDQEPADIVLGQANMTGTATGTTSTTFDGPNLIYSNGERLFVADYNNNRILIWNTFPTANGQAADLVLGQPNMTTGTANTGGASDQSLSGPAVYSDGVRLYVSDYNNNRVLIWNTLPIINREAADVVLGQANMTSTAACTTTINTFCGPWGITRRGSRLVISDYGNSRILVWNSIPTTNQPSANVVIGQPNFTSNSTGTTSQSLNSPYHPEIIGSKLFVSDTGNNRLLFWNAIPNTNYHAAAGVIGQPDFTSNTVNNGGLSGATFSTPVEFR